MSLGSAFVVGREGASTTLRASDVPNASCGRRRVRGRMIPRPWTLGLVLRVSAVRGRRVLLPRFPSETAVLWLLSRGRDRVVMADLGTLERALERLSCAPNGHDTERRSDCRRLVGSLPSSGWELPPASHLFRLSNLATDVLALHLDDEESPPDRARGERATEGCPKASGERATGTAAWEPRGERGLSRLGTPDRKRIHHGSTLAVSGLGYCSSWGHNARKHDLESSADDRS